jgi:hypothetical protein
MILKSLLVMATANKRAVVGPAAEEDSSSKDPAVLVHIAVQNEAAHPLLTV